MMPGKIPQTHQQSDNHNSHFGHQQQSKISQQQQHSLIQVETFASFSTNQKQQFHILVDKQCEPSQLTVNITNPTLGTVESNLNWISSNDNINQSNGNGTSLDTTPDNHNQQQQNYNKCRVFFQAPIVGLYTINIEHSTNPQCNTRFMTKAYDLAKVFIHKSSTSCQINENYEFSVDASEAGEGQLEIAINEGEIPNQVQVLNNGKCIVSFVPEDLGPHMVDIKFNGHNVNGCPFVVDVTQSKIVSSSSNDHQVINGINTSTRSIEQQLEPKLIKNEKILVDTTAIFSLENIELDSPSLKDIIVTGPDGQLVDCVINEDQKSFKYSYEFKPSTAGDHIVEIRGKSALFNKLPTKIIQQFPFPLKVFDFNKVLVSEVTDGVVGNPIYFFIDASGAGSGNLEIRVSSPTTDVPNYPNSEPHAKIRVNFTPTEPVDHYIDVKFNGFSVPGNPFLVKVARYPQAKLTNSNEEILKYVSLGESTPFYIDYIGNNNKKLLNDLTASSCQVAILQPDFKFTRLNDIELLTTVNPKTNEKETKFKVNFKPQEIGTHHFFITVNNELLPSSPIKSNVCDINQVKVSFPQALKTNSGSIKTENQQATSRPIAQLNKPMTFTVDASRAGEGTLALVVSAGSPQDPVEPEVRVSEGQAQGLYELTFVPTKFAPHSIDMSFNERCVPNSPFIVDILDADGNIASVGEKKTNINQEANNNTNNKLIKDSLIQEDRRKVQELARDVEQMKLISQQDNNSYPSEAPLQHQSIPETIPISSKKSLAYGLVNASNIVYLESGVLENTNNRVSLVGPRGEKVPFILAKGSPQRGQPKKTYLEYKPKEIGTHTINVLENGKELRQYFVETCDPSLVRVIGLGSKDIFVVGQEVKFLIDSQKSGEIQLDNIFIHGPKVKHKDGENTILGRLKSSVSSSSSNHSSANNQSLEYSIHRLNDHQQEVTFVPQISGKHSIYIKCLGQQVGSSPYEIDVKEASPIQDSHNNGLGENSGAMLLMNDKEVLQNIIVHGLSLKCSPVNSTGAFIIETNRFAQATDFDVIITDPNNSPVDVQFYVQQNANLLAEWVPKRVGPHKIIVLYKDEHVPGSPFITEAFDPSGVVIEKIPSASNYFNVNEKIELKVDRRHAGCGELDVAISSPARNELPIDVKPIFASENEELMIGELISFIPPVSGKYKLAILFGGFEIPNSPISFNVRDFMEPIKISGSGLERGAEVNRTAQFMVETSGEGQLKVRIECGDREIVPKVDRVGNCYTIKYKPIIVGYAAISLYWNGSHIEGSPFAVPVNDLSRIQFLNDTNHHHHQGTTNSTNANQRIYHYEPNQPLDITLDTAKCGPGQLVAEAYCRANPNIKFSLPVDQYAVNRYRLTFVCPPKREQLDRAVRLDDISLAATYVIRFYYNNLSIPEQLASVFLSPHDSSIDIQQAAINQDSSSSKVSQISSLNGSQHSAINDTNNNNHHKNNKISDLKPAKKQLNHHNNNHDAFANGQQQQVTTGRPEVSLRGHGLAEARTGEQAEFTINGSKAGPGEPQVTLSSLEHDSLDVDLQLTGEKIYLASYTPLYGGKYTLNVLWDDKQVAGCPLEVNVADTCDATKVLCTGDGLKGGVLGEEIKVLIDTRRAGPGELTALCMGSQLAAISELLDRGDGTFILYIKPQEAGRHILTIKYGGQQIPRSPFTIKVSGKPDPSQVRVHGPGIEHGVLSLYQSRFVCDTRGAGAGQLTVRIRGPKGAFRMETQRASQRDRTILCKYDPTEPGDYRIEIKWSGQHVPGSPFHVMIFDTQEELNRFLSGLSPYYYNYM